MIYGIERKIIDSDSWVQTSAVQLPDGTLDSAEGPSRSDPGISVNSSWENYLTGSQARQLAAAIIASADELDTWTRERHGCPFSWCTTRPRHTDDQDHWSGITYTTASLRHGDPYHLEGDRSPLTVGAGVAYVEGQMPAVVVHLDGGQYDYDHDAFLRLDEAYELRRALDQAIDHATEAFSHMCDEIVSGAHTLGGDK
ncbi:hypothetical protein AWC11_16980 [Mycobacterium interjectum]|nr:hypothetical protein AWC11_16980 [Mycobacterium interjectum]